MKKIIAIASVLLAVVACKKENIVENAPADGMKKVTFTADIPDCEFGKASLDGKVVVWEKGEKVAVYDGVNAEPNSFEVLSVEGGTASISGQIAVTATGLAAVYPFSAAKGFAEGVLTVNIPVGQVIPEGKFIDPDVLVSVAKANVGENLAFKNVVSLIKFTVAEEGATSVLFVGNSGEKFFGNAAVDPATAVATGAGATRGKVSAAAGTSFTKDAVYYAAVYPCEFPAGLNVTTAMSDCKYYKNSTKSNSFARNSGLDLGNLAGGVKLPLTITTKAELDTWAKYATCYVKGEQVKLGADINYEEGEWKGVYDYIADFDGQNHSIYNIKIVHNPDAEASCQGFFTVLRHNTAVKDVVFGMDPSTGAYDGKSTNVLSGPEEYAGVVALVKNDNTSEKVRLHNIKNYIPIDRAASSETTEGLRFGGICGALAEDSAAEIKNCCNFGNVGNSASTKNKTSYYAGILGYANTSNVLIENCSNEGEICLGGPNGTVSGASFAGGITGRFGTSKNNVIKDCVNKGKVYTAKNVSGAIPYVGGILGADKTTSGLEADEFHIRIINCKNTGLLSENNQSEGSICGGIIALMQAKTIVEGCTNEGDICKAGNHGSTAMFGGIAGKTVAADGACIKDCTNKGKLYEVAQTSKKTIFFGGIAAVCLVDVTGCTNSGDIVGAATNGTEYIGGIAGSHGDSAFAGGGSKVENCKVEGCKLTMTWTTGAVGGIFAGQGKDACTTGEDCKVDCEISAAAPASAGMIIGTYNDKTISTTFGSAEKPISVKGTFCSNAVTAENLASVLEGSATAAESHTFNAVLGE